jgi:hypothetical protein
MAAHTFLRGRLAWFLSTATPNGQDVPPVLGVPTLCLSAALPLTIYLTEHLHQPAITSLNALFLVVAVAFDLHAHAAFVEGMAVGRRELVAEIVRAWQQDQISPTEYVHREIWLESDEISEARRTVRRSAKR